MSARHAVLGMLRDGPAHSYELAARICALLGPGFDINTGQMSALTNRLQRDEFIELVGHPAQSGRRPGSDRRIYALTAKGAAEYEAFFEHGPNEAKTFRRSLLVKLALAGPDRLADAFAQLDGYEQRVPDRIGELLGELEEILPDDDLRPRVRSGRPAPRHRRRHLPAAGRASLGSPCARDGLLAPFERGNLARRAVAA